MTTNRTIKGITRQYRKAIRKIGLRNFPLSGAFHWREKGAAVPPEKVTPEGRVFYGTAPLTIWKPKTPAAPSVEPAPILPALTVEPVFRRVTSTGICNGREKIRVNYRPCRNPKSGETVYVKRLKDGKQRWTAVNYSDLLNPVNVAS